MKRLLTFFGIFALLFGSLLLIGEFQPQRLAEASSHSCSISQAAIIEPTTTALNPVQDVRVQSNYGAPVEKVVFKIDGKTLGLGHFESGSGTSSEVWFMQWSTHLSEADDYQLRAEVTFADSTMCLTQPIPVIDTTPLAQNLDIELAPEEWIGPTNVPAHFMIEVIGGGGGAADHLRDFADISWSVNGVGTVNPLPVGTAEYYSPVAGEGEVRALVRYGGEVYDAESDTEVTSQYAGSDNTDDGDETDSDDQDDDEGDDDDEDEPLVVLREPTVEPAEAITQLIESSDVIESCLSDNLGEGSLQRVVSENRRPTPGEFRQYLECFADRNYVIPTILAPLAPENVATVKESDDVAIRTILNRDIAQEDGARETALVLSGTAAPNSTVFIYVFSDPLVLVATADANGNWEYALEDPLPSGKHEVYALVDKGDGEYERSSLASFFVGTAEATEENPNGYSLDLVSEPTIAVNNRSANVFIASTIGVTVFAITLFVGFLVYRFRNRNTMVTGESHATSVGPSDDTSIGS